MRIDRPPIFRKIAGIAFVVAAIGFAVGVSFAQSPPAAGVPRLEHRAPPSAVRQLPWYDKPDFLTAITSIGALLISIVALTLSYRSSSAQEGRQKREELRNIIERLVTLREEFTGRINGIVDGAERMNYSIFANTKRSIYLQAAEALVKELPGEISSSEYCVLGAENAFESDFLEARRFYREGVKAAKGTSLVAQAVAWRALAASYFTAEPLNPEEGRRCYQESLDVILQQKQRDPYSLYTMLYTYRDWANGELCANDRERAAEKLAKAQEFLFLLPAGYNLKNDEIRLLAMAWSGLGSNFFQDPASEIKSLEEARSAFQRGIELLQESNDPAIIDCRGLIYQNWAREEMLHGFMAKALELANRARESFELLDPSYPWRLEKIRGLQQIFSGVAPPPATLVPSSPPGVAVPPPPVPRKFTGQPGG
jgi:hypothetical protein